MITLLSADGGGMVNTILMKLGPRISLSYLWRSRPISGRIAILSNLVKELGWGTIPL